MKCLGFLPDLCGDLACSTSHTELFEGRQCFPTKITGCFAVAGRITSQQHSSKIGLSMRATLCTAAKPN